LIYPDLQEAVKLARDFSVIPVCKTVLADTETPIRLYDRVKDQPYSFLLESVEGGERWSRYSFVGSSPCRVIKSREGRMAIRDQRGERTAVTSDPLSDLNEQLAAYRSPVYDGYPPFLGGAVGYFGYEIVRFFEPARPVAKQAGLENSAYDLHFMVMDRLLVFDHLKQEVIFIQHLQVPKNGSQAELRERYEETVKDLERWANELLSKPVSATFSGVTIDREPVDLSSVTANLSKEAYVKMVEKAKEYIRAGDLFQVVLSRKLTWAPAPDPFEVYRVLRVLNPSPYMYYLRLGEETIVGTSPELLVRVTGGRAETRPIAGSRPRGKTAEEENRLLENLLADEKERAEHVMLVDLGRNDLGRVADIGSVTVTDFMTIEKYSHIMHLVSHVEAKLKEGKVPADAFRACFPAGTLSGAPKIRAMEIISELEPDLRGVYGGAIGYLSFTGNLDTCIAIRTIYFHKGQATVQSGGGIVADSDPELELQESVNKAMGMLKALELAAKRTVGLSC
jgi:anthranilate synthase component 1